MELNLPQPSLVLASTPEMGYVKNMVGDHEDQLRKMDCDMAQLRLKLVELQSLREGFKHFVAEHWLPLIQYLHSITNTQCSCGTDARNGTDSASSYHTLPQCSSLRPIPLPQTRPPSPSPSIPALDSQSKSNSDSDDNLLPFQGFWSRLFPATIPIRVSDTEDGASGYEAAGEDEIDN